MADDNRFFPNPWLTDFNRNFGNRTTEHQELLENLRPKIISEIETDLAIIDSHYTRHISDQSVYTGSAGAALLHLHLALSIFIDDKDRRERELRLCLQLIKPSLANLKTRRFTFLCGGAGPLAIGCIAYHKLEQTAERDQCAVRLCDMFKTNVNDFKSCPSELLYGHCGYLYALLFVNAFIPGLIDCNLIEEICQVVIDAGKGDAYQYCPLMYTWHDKHYLGAAHGLTGILTLLLQAKHLTVVSSNLDAIKATIDYLLSLKFPSGNFPSSLESSTRDTLVQWCHGSPGLVHLLALAYQVFGDSKYLVAAEECGEVVWERGLLVKGYGLCHGTGGNGYTFLQLYKVTGHVYHLMRALKFSEWCLSSNDRQCSSPDSPFSLFQGLTGKIMFLVDVYCDPTKCYFHALELPTKSSSLSSV